MAHGLYRSIVLPRPIDEVFAFFADAANLQRITPPELDFRILTPLPIEMQPGTLIEYRLSLFGFPFGWLTEIARWDPPHRFVDRQLRGPYRHWVHTHEFTPVEGGTRMRDHVAYLLPLPPLGLTALPLVRRELQRIFDYRERSFRELLGDAVDGMDGETAGADAGSYETDER